MLKAGDTAPEIVLPDQNGKMHKLSEYLGKYVLVYFYPKDDTPGCTKEACLFRDNLPKLKNIDAEVIGVSADNIESHKKFAEKYKLPFTILADREKKTVKDYGTWQLKKFMGREFWGTVRSSFLVGPKGIIVKIYPKVSPAIHAGEVLRDLEEIKGK